MRLMYGAAQFGGAASSIVFLVITCGQIRAYGYRGWRRLGMGVGTDTRQEVEKVLEREERLIHAIEIAETVIEHQPPG